MIAGRSPSLHGSLATRSCRLQTATKPRYTAVGAKDDEDTIAAIEDIVTGKSKKAKRKAKKAARAGESKPFQQDSGLKEALEGGNLTEAQIFEGNVITILGLIFSLCILEGLAVAASGFFPDNIDQWIQDNVYTAFSPTIVLFLACSSVYGVWKTRQE
eukprot:jgi/Ulvmu1/1110/UM106_0027.1